VPREDRLVHLDVLRCAALFGVLMVNLLTEFRVSLFVYLDVFHTHPGRLNHAVDLLSGLLLEFKAFAIFSVLFGVGMAVQAERVGSRGARYGPFARRRFAGLLVLGLAHMVLVWDGDILTEYALVGLLLAPLVPRAPGALALGATFALTLHAWPARLPDVLPHGAALQQHAARALRAYGQGSYAEALAFRAEETRRYIAPLLAVALPRVAGLMLLGAWSYRRGIARAPGEHLPALRATAALGLLGGGAVTGYEAWAAMHGVALGRYAPTVSAVGSIGLALGYAAAALLALVRPRVARVAGRALAPLGQMALTNYLLQSVALTWVFYGHGLGRFARMAPAPAAALGVALFAAQAALSAAWLARFRFGPVEWLWRSWTYGAAQPMRRR
jgi:uncharacterized protein